MKKNKNFIIMLFVMVMGLNMTMWDYAPLYGAEVEIPSSFNPVGSGARALGMGGAFIAVADDATAASWNPGGLTQLKKPECSVVGAFYSRSEDLTFGTNPEADGSHSISDSNINYLSASYPFEAFNHNMIVSLSYQHLYDFNRDWEFTLKQDTDLQVSDDNWEYRQSGSLTALGFSYCVRVIPQLSVGFTLNLWDDDLTRNNWEEDYRMTSSGTMFEEDRFAEKYSKTDERSIQGFNYNLGLLWRINYKWTLGAVFKAPFKADVKHKIYRNSIMQIQLSDEGTTDESSDIESNTEDEELEMPMSYGLGIVYNISDNFSISGDIYRTEWSGCIYKNADGKETSPITGGSASDIEPTHQIRIGGEYRFINEEKGYLIPIRAGFFYDPAPTDGSPDDFYGMSLGIGFSKNDWFSLDIAYQYRYGDDIGDHLMKGFRFSQDVDEHIVYLSMIWYKF